MVLDEIIFIYFKAPHSFTGEDILELHIHGNRLNIKRALYLFVSNNLCRLAKEGEFSYRAFKNKKMTLTQVEGLERFINARTPLALTSGMSLLNGELNREYIELYASFLHLKSSYELGIDFLEDVGEKEFDLNLERAIFQLDKRVESLSTKAKFFNKDLLSPQVVVFGMPNAGKSSFFNYVLNKDRSIISNIPGTTRDYVSEYVEFSSSLVKFVDTAGLRDTDDQIEKEGIKKTVDLFDRAIFKILIVNPLDQFFFTSAQGIISKKFDLVVFTHCENLDLEQLRSYISCINSPLFLTASFEPSAPKGAIVIDTKSGPIGPLLEKEKINPVSPGEGNEFIGPIGPRKGKEGPGPIGPAKEKEGPGPIGPTKEKDGPGPIGPRKEKDGSGPIGPTKEKNGSGPIGPAKEKVGSGPIGPEYNLLKILDYLITNKINQASKGGLVAERHVSVIEDLSFHWKNFLLKSKTTSDLAIVLSELLLVEDSVGELVGHLAPDDVLGNIFKNFCIGK